MRVDRPLSQSPAHRRLSAVLLAVHVVACHPKPGDETTTTDGETTADTTTSDSSTTAATGSSTTATTDSSTTAADDCEGVLLANGVCYGRYELPEVPAYRLEAADCDNDGRTDLIVGDGSTGTLSLFFWIGDGEYLLGPPSVPIESPLATIEIADIDGDLDLDIIHHQGHSVDLFITDGNALVHLHHQDLVAKINALAVVDFDLDGRAEEFLVEVQAGIELWRLQGSQLEYSGLTYMTHPSCPWVVDLIAEDLNGDNIPDIIAPASGVCDQDEGAETPLRVFLGSPDFTLVSVGDFSVGSFPEGYAIGDFNGDAHKDVVVENDISKDLSLLYGNGDGTFQPQIRFVLAGGLPHEIRAADYNLDGKSELFFTQNFGVHIAPDIPAPDVVKLIDEGTRGQLSLGDYNGDGVVDVAHSERSDAHLVLILSNE